MKHRSPGMIVIVETVQYKPGSFKEEVCLSWKRGPQLQAY